MVPMVPIARGVSAYAALAGLRDACVPPFGATMLSELEPAEGDMVIFMQSNEPSGLYCADEIDGESLRPCQQVVEGLFQYGKEPGEILPALATACQSNEEATVWICSLREGVLFHDGYALDANDVVVSWAAGIDASGPYHVGNTGGFDYYAYLWDNLMNLP